MRITPSWLKNDGVVFFLIVFCTFTLRFLQLDAYPIPYPHISDELANVFAAKTYDAGKITNTTPDFIHSLSVPTILEQPSWMSKYPPAPSAFMALGILLTGNAYWGVVLVTALAIAAAYWAILGWTHQRILALSAAFLLIIIFKAPNYWINSYWGGSTAFLAVMLMLGAYARVIFERSICYLWVAALGAMIGMMTRPYEMLVFILFLNITALIRICTQWSCNERQKLWRYLPRLILPFLLFLAANGYYNHTITGDVLKLPHVLYSEQYGIAPLFRFGELQSKPFSDLSAMQSSQRFEIEGFRKLASYPKQLFVYVPAALFSILCVETEGKAQWLQTILVFQRLAIIILLPLLCVQVFLSKKHKNHRLELGGGLIVTWLASSIPTGLHAHYLSGILALLVIAFSLYTQNVVMLAAMWKRYLFYLIIVVFFIPAALYGTTYYGMEKIYITHRAETAEWLEKQPYQSIVFVNHDVEFKSRLVGEVWGNYSPFPEQEKIVWAYYLSDVENQKIIDAYPNRNLWYIEPFKEKKLIPYAEITKDSHE